MTNVKKITPIEVEKIRLILSTYQDGSGMLAGPDGTSLPGWRDFERAVAIALSGQAQEDKSIFDVVLPKKGRGHETGISCKMRRELDKVDKIGRVCFELSNSSGQFWDHLKTNKINQRNYRKHSARTGCAIIHLVKYWHESASASKDGPVDLSRSFYLVLLWDRTNQYQLYQFSSELPNPETLRWHFPSSKCLRGDDEGGTLFEWYGESGGQLKYYPRAEGAVWSSKHFKLEPLQNKKYAVLEKVKAYFPKLWEKTFGK